MTAVVTDLVRSLSELKAQDVGTQVEKVNEYLKTQPSMKKISEKTGLQPVVLTAGVFAFVFLMFIFDFGTETLSFAVSQVYPALLTLRSLKQQNNDAAKYWILFVLILILEYPLCFLTAMVPLYNFFRLVGFYFLFSQDFSKSAYVYDTYVARAGEQYADKLTSFFDQLN